VKKLSDIISEAPLFNGLPDDQILEIVRIAVERCFKKNEMIFSEGDEGNGFYIVAEGRVKI